MNYNYRVIEIGEFKNEDWMGKRKKHFALADKTIFATSALDSVKLSTVHTTNTWKKE